jgi:U3 small nucleolar ribonucleoprotein protein LCP5
LEKVKPLETKMKYQIDKLIKAASSTDLANVDQSTVDDPYMFKPNPNLLVQDDDEDEDGNDAEDGDGVYKAPRIAPMPYDDNPGYSKEMRSEQRKKEKASRSRMLRDLANQYSEAPEQDKVIGTINLEDDDRELMERETYEEDNFIRLTQSKKQKKKIERLNQRSLHNELLDFDDFHGSGKMSELDLGNKQTSLSRSKRLSRNDSDDDDEGFGGSSGKKRRGGDSLDNLVTDGFRSSVKDGKFGHAKRSMKKKMNKKRR